MPYRDITGPHGLTDHELMAGVPIDLRDAGGRAVTLELRIHRSSVECWIGEVRYAVFDRSALRHWLARPDLPLRHEEVSWIRAHRDTVAVVIDGVVPRWSLADHVLDSLRSRI